MQLLVSDCLTGAGVGSQCPSFMACMAAHPSEPRQGREVFLGKSPISPLDDADEAQAFAACSMCGDKNIYMLCRKAHVKTTLIKNTKE